MLRPLIPEEPSKETAWISLWKNDPNAFQKRKDDSTSLKALLFPEKYAMPSGQ